jgi:hypothetical protein
MPPHSCIECQDPGRPNASSVRFEVLGAGGRISTFFGIWLCAQGGMLKECVNPVPLEKGGANVHGTLIVTPADDEVRVFVNDALLYTAKRAPRDLGARVLLFSEPEHALAVAIDPAEQPSGFATIAIEVPLTTIPALPVRILPQSERGCWHLVTPGEGSYVDPLAVTISDPFRTTGFYLPPVFSGCVLHAGESSAKGQREKLPGGQLGAATGSCSYDAECIRERGKSYPGDGLVSLECEAQRCTCTLEPLEPKGKPIVFEVTLDGPCTSTTQARDLIVARCMVGMELASGQKAGATD